MSPIPLHDLEEGGLNAPIANVATLDEFSPDSKLGASRYRHELPGGKPLDALLVNKGSDILVVNLHGALDLKTQTPPRFERLRSISQFDVSALYFSDPTILLGKSMQLAWYTGWDGVDVQQIIADWSLIAARSIGATRIVFSGSSGGGFAALQVSALTPGSLAVPINPQTSIYGYLADNKYWGPQHTYLLAVWPQIAPGGLSSVDFSKDWTAVLDDRVSAMRRYEHPLDNYVFAVINRNEFHYQKHWLPLLGAAARGGNLGRFWVQEYEGSLRHNPPSPEQFRIGLAAGLQKAVEIPPAL
ncbi:hypothetical protein [Kocuria sp. SM24M-10]|uniref:hypothetical protein n=1 Tax=Kocuria sp. SM24M-10 TaxID=1660349 RepID=UPI000B1C542A|nr:hypothetical protein [Kocuria sp. SM24M-10]